ncbi:hypothetical protein Mapa_017064 [Marchantia paleacea]|nr:hypothetical protein Mapa_017064 [Marchantia paleacea]
MEKWRSCECPARHSPICFCVTESEADLCLTTGKPTDVSSYFIEGTVLFYMEEKLNLCHSCCSVEGSVCAGRRCGIFVRLRRHCNRFTGQFFPRICTRCSYHSLQRLE